MGRQSAFVLAEALIVSIIVAILAAVAVPIYSGYVKAEKLKVVDGLAQTAAVSANAFWRRHGVQPDSAQLNLFIPNASEYSLTITGTNVTVSYASDHTISATVAYR